MDLAFHNLEAIVTLWCVRTTGSLILVVLTFVAPLLEKAWCSKMAAKENH